MPHLLSHKNGEQFQLGDMEALLHDTCWKFGVEKFSKANCSAAGKPCVRGEKMRIGNDDVGRYHRDPLKCCRKNFHHCRSVFLADLTRVAITRQSHDIYYNTVQLMTAGQTTMIITIFDSSIKTLHRDSPPLSEV